MSDHESQCGQVARCLPDRPPSKRRRIAGFAVDGEEVEQARGENRAPSVALGSDVRPSREQTSNSIAPEWAQRTSGFVSPSCRHSRGRGTQQVARAIGADTPVGAPYGPVPGGRKPCGRNAPDCAVRRPDGRKPEPEPDAEPDTGVVVGTERWQEGGWQEHGEGTGDDPARAAAGRGGASVVWHRRCVPSFLGIMDDRLMETLICLST